MIGSIKKENLKQKEESKRKIHAWLYLKVDHFWAPEKTIVEDFQAKNEWDIIWRIDFDFLLEFCWIDS